MQKTIIQLAYNLIPPPPKTLIAHPYEIILRQSLHYIFMKFIQNQTFLHFCITNFYIPQFRSSDWSGQVATLLHLSLAGTQVPSKQANWLLEQEPM